MRNKRTLITGFTLVELIIYIALISVFITSSIYFAWDVIYGREKANQEQVVAQSARIALEKIAKEIRSAKDVQSISPGQLVLDKGGSTTAIELSSGVIRISPSGLGPYNLTSNQVRVTDLSFTDLSTSNAKSLKVTIKLEQSSQVSVGQLKAETLVETSVELNSQFNQSRRLLTDLTFTVLVSETSLQGTFIKNSGTNDVVIDKLDISWVGTLGGENVTAVQIGGGPVEWTGSSPSGATIELNDFTLVPSDGIVAVDYFNFDSSVSGATFNLAFVMTDGSLARSEVVLGVASPTPSPTSSPTPTPGPTPTPSSCTSYCQSLGYSLGTCRANAGVCNQSGETQESGGNQFCTGGPSLDTCCCAP